jgi:hypothetical protein
MPKLSPAAHSALLSNEGKSNAEQQLLSVLDLYDDGRGNYDVPAGFLAKVEAARVKREGFGGVSYVGAPGQAPAPVAVSTSKPKQHNADILNRVDLFEIMEWGVEPPWFAVPERIVGGGVPHRFYGPMSSGKTMDVLACAVYSVNRQQTVIWVDLEMGRNLIAERLVALGAHPLAVAAHFVYLDQGSLDRTEPSVKAWKGLLDANPDTAFIVVDAQMEVLAQSGLNENYASDVLKWNDSYLRPALTRGISTVLIDHSGHDAAGRARGSSAKGQASRIELEYEKLADFDRETIGRMKITVTKNAIAADLPKTQTWELGGGKPFVWRRVEDSTEGLLASIKEDARIGMGERIIEVIAEIGPCTTNQWRTLVQGKDKDKREAAAFLRDAGRLHVEPSANRSLVWSVVEHDGCSPEGVLRTPIGAGYTTTSDAGDAGVAQVQPADGPHPNADEQTGSRDAATSAARCSPEPGPHPPVQPARVAQPSKRKRAGRTAPKRPASFGAGQ